VPLKDAFGTGAGDLKVAFGALTVLMASCEASLMSRTSPPLAEVISPE
jgi:hypothetical protein